MTYVPFSRYAFVIVAAALCTFITGCDEDPLIQGAICCACLLTHDQSGEQITMAEGEDLPPNCYPVEGSFDTQNQSCSEGVAKYITDDEGGVIKVQSNECYESVCEQECKASIEIGIPLEVVDDG